MADIAVAVTAGTNDGFGHGASLYATSTWFQAGKQGGVVDTAYFRFVSVGLPNGAVVSEAHLKYVATGFTAGTLLVSGVCTVDDAALGTLHYAPTASDFASIGEYWAELEYTQSGVIESSETFKIRVSESG